MIYKEVEKFFGEDLILARNIKIYLVKSYSGKRLKEIGDEFGIGESGVSQTSRSLAQRIEKEKKLKADIARIVKGLDLPEMKYLPG